MKTMKRGLALVLALLLALSAMSALAADNSVAINSKNFPDETFRSYVQKKFDTNKDNKLSAAEIKKATFIDVSEKKAIKNLKGIQYFTALKRLYCSETSITTLDLSKNTNLTEVGVGETPLSSLKLGKLKKLHTLEATDTKLKKLDISGCDKLMSYVKGYYYIEDGCVTWAGGQDAFISVSTSTKLMNGSKVLRQYAKPKSIKFSKSSLSLKKNKDYDLFTILKFTPSTSYYKLKFSSDKSSIVEVDSTDGMAYAKKKGTATVTVTCGGQTAKIKVTVK